MQNVLFGRPIQRLVCSSNLVSPVSRFSFETIQIIRCLDPIALVLVEKVFTYIKYISRDVSEIVNIKYIIYNIKNVNH